jgi:hypothetical protein
LGTGYTRNDTSNNIADGKQIDAADLDGEFDAIQSAFNEATGHTHDGTSAEGAPIIVTGPAQEYLFDGTAIYPKTDDTYDLGKAAAEWKDLYVDGTGYLDSASVSALTVSTSATFNGATIADLGTVTTADIDGGTIDGVTIGGSSAGAGTFTTLSVSTSSTIDLSSNTSSGDLAVTDGGTGASTASAARTNLGVAIGSDVQAHDDQLDDIAALAVTNGNFIVGDGTNWVAESGATARTSLGLGSIATQNSNNVSITGGSIAGITDVAVADGGTGASTATGARTNLGLVIGTDVQAQDSSLQAIADETITGVTGSDPSLVTGTAGTTNYTAKWDANGDLVDGYEVETTLTDDDTKIAGSGGVVDYVAANVAMSESYASTGQTMTAAGLITLAHGLSSQPKMIRLYAKCTTAEEGYSIGDNFDITAGQSRGTGVSDQRGFSVTFDATNVYVRNGASSDFISTVDGSNGTTATLARANWDLYVEAYA